MTMVVPEAPFPLVARECRSDRAGMEWVGPEITVLSWPDVKEVLYRDDKKVLEVEPGGDCDPSSVLDALQMPYRFISLGNQPTYCTYPETWWFFEVPEKASEIGAAIQMANRKAILDRSERQLKEADGESKRKLTVAEQLALELLEERASFIHDKEFIAGLQDGWDNSLRGRVGREVLDDCRKVLGGNYEFLVERARREGKLVPGK